jgi:hypothetical protein
LSEHLPSALLGLPAACDDVVDEQHGLAAQGGRGETSAHAPRPILCPLMLVVGVIEALAQNIAPLRHP